MSSSNNIFSYATKELSQDAVLCWILNDKTLKVRFLNDVCSRDESGSLLQNPIKIKSIQAPLRQARGIDILVLGETGSGQKAAFIIEDKTDTSLHDEQVKKYSEYVEKEYKPDNIHFILFKSGEYTFWERDEFSSDIKKAGIKGHFYSAGNLLAFLTNNTFAPSWGRDYIEYLKTHLPKNSWMTDLSRTTETIKDLLLETEYNHLDFRITKPKASLGDRKWGISVYGIHGGAIENEKEIIINKNYSLYPYVTLDPESNTAKICVQYNLYYYKTLATEVMEGYKPLKTIGKTELEKWRQKRDELRDYTKTNTKTMQKGLGQMIVYKVLVDVDYNGDWHELKTPLNEAIKIAKELEQIILKE